MAGRVVGKGQKYKDISVIHQGSSQAEQRGSQSASF